MPAPFEPWLAAARSDDGKVPFCRVDRLARRADTRGVSDHHGFSSEEWELIVELPLDIYLTMLGVEVAVESLAEEVHALDVWRSRAAVACADSAWMKDAVQNAHRPSRAQARGQNPLSEAQLLPKLRELARTLDQRVDAAEARAFKRLLLTLAEQIASASDGVSHGGARVSQRESDLIWRIRQALAL
jgi:hypothetical protein